jgi:hypothetical protein
MDETLFFIPCDLLINTGFVVSKTKKIQRLSKIFAAYFQRLFKDLLEQSAVEKLQV